MEGFRTIDESEIEKLIPNFGELSSKEQKKVLEAVYSRQFNIRFAKSPLGTVKTYHEEVMEKRIKQMEGENGD